MQKRWLVLVCALGAVCVAAAAYAGLRHQVTAATVTTTSGNCLAQANARESLALDASAATANIGYCEGVSCTAVIGAAGTSTLVAGSIYFWPADSAPKSALCFISASGSQPLTIREGFR